jgi:hypothetical protein
MHVAASVLEIPPGRDVLEALAAAENDGIIWMQAVGQLEDIELSLAGVGAPTTRTLAGRFTLLSLTGPRSGPFMVTLTRASESGFEVLGGVLLRARSAGVTVARLGPPDGEQGESTMTTITRARPPAPTTQPTGGELAGGAKTHTGAWGAAVRASAAAAARAETDGEDERAPEAGDLVDHFSFGLCTVVSAEGDRLRIRDAAAGAGRIREVSIDMLRVMPPTEQDGKLVYRLLRRT